MSRLTHRDPSRTAAAAHQQQQTTSASYGRPPIGSSGGSTPDHARPLMPTYGRTHPAPLHPPFQSSPSFHNHRTAEQLEAQNDDAIEGLSAKVRLLKDISLNIGTEVKQSSSLIASLNVTFSEASGALSGTFRRMDRMAQKQYGRWWYWFLFLILVFWVFVFTWLWRR